jgi:flagellar biosynthesis component FlhA
MGKNTKIILMVAAAVVTIVGLITGRYIFIFLMLPLGFLFKGKNTDK